MKFKNFTIIALIFVIPLIAYMVLSHSDASVANKVGNTNKPKIIKFTSAMCMDCKKLSTEMKEVYPKYSDKITLIEVQVQNNDEFTKKQIDKYNITLVPTLIISRYYGVRVYVLKSAVCRFNAIYVCFRSRINFSYSRCLYFKHKRFEKFCAYFRIITKIQRYTFSFVINLYIL